MKLRLVVIALLAAVFLAVWICATTLRKEGAPVPASVAYVIDGDTIIVDTAARKNIKVRLIGIDTPETVDRETGVEPYGREASDYTKMRLDGRNIRLEYDAQTTDRYGRDLAYVWLGEELFNETLVMKGYAQVTTYPPNDKYADRFAAAQDIAVRNTAGLWGEK